MRVVDDLVPVLGRLQAAQVPLLAAAGRGEYLIDRPGLVAKSVVKRIAHYGKDRIGDGDLSRYRLCGKAPYEEAKNDQMFHNGMFGKEQKQ